MLKYIYTNLYNILILGYIVIYIIMFALLQKDYIISIRVFIYITKNIYINEYIYDIR